MQPHCLPNPRTHFKIPLSGVAEHPLSFSLCPQYQNIVCPSGFNAGQTLFIILEIIHNSPEIDISPRCFLALSGPLRLFLCGSGQVSLSSLMKLHLLIMPPLLLAHGRLMLFQIPEIDCLFQCVGSALFQVGTESVA